MTLYLPDGSPWDGTPRDGKARAVAKAATGPGVGFFNTGTPLSFIAKTPQEMMKRAQLAYHVNPWVGTAESVVTRKVVGLPWHLEDGEDEEYTEDPPEDVRAARLLIERPQFMLPPDVRKPGTGTRRLMWSITSRHLGLCGMAYWYADQVDTRGIPLAWLYINPARMWPSEDTAGNLTGWVLDAQDRYGHGGTPLELAEVLPFYLDPPDWGNLGTGLYERAVLKSQITNLADQHAAYVLGTGGRIAGMVSPKEGTIPDEAFQVLLREFRNVNEAPDAAKRTTILQNPVDFTPTAADPSELDLVELAKMNRDDVFTIWGVPGSQAPVQTAAGLNSGETKGYDEAILMQGAVHDRVGSMLETLQYGWLDRYQPVVIELVIEEPEFDDETPAFGRLAASREAPLTNKERRAIIGLDPTGDDAIDNAILLPMTLSVWATAPGEGEKEGTIAADEAPVPVPPQLTVVPPIIEEAKASAQREFLGLRSGMETRTVPAVRKSVSAVLQAQRTHIAARIRDKGAHLAKKPSDTTVWWNERAEDERLSAALLPTVAGIAETVTRRAKEVLDRPAKAEAFEERVGVFVAKRATERIRKMNQTTREQVQDAIVQGFEQGLSPGEVASLIEGSTTFDEMRAERIARSETMYAYNDAALNSYTEFGVEMVEPLDGDEDPECVARLERGPVSIDEAMDDIDHPNGTLDWAPYFGSGKAEPIRPSEPLPVSLPTVAPPLDIAALVASIAEAMRPAKAEPTTVQIVTSDTQMRTVIDYDDYGDFKGYHEEAVVPALIRNPDGDIMEAV